MHPTQQVGAISNRDAGTVRQLQRMQPGVEDIVYLAMAVFRQSELPAASGKRRVGHQCGHIVGVVLLEQWNAALIHQVAMLDAAHAALESTIDGARGVSVPRDIEIGRLSLLHGGPNLVPRRSLHLRKTVADDPQARTAGAAIIGGAAPTAPITMAASLGQRLAPEDQSWTLQIALVDGRSQSIVCPSDVAHGGKAPAEHAP